VYCVSCDYELESQGNFCPRCKQPTLSQEKPRHVRMAQSFGVYSKIAAFGLLFLALCASFTYYIVGPWP